MPVKPATAEAFSFAVQFGARAGVAAVTGGTVGLALPLPVLGGETREEIFAARGKVSNQQGFELLHAGDIFLGCVAEPVTDPRQLSAQTRRLYRRMLELGAGRHLYRVWNYVPGINAIVGELENYRAFCEGRSLAFEDVFGPAFPRSLPSASAVGTDDNHLCLVFAAGPAAPHHVENPEQVPAYRYPAEHGPRSPSFSRATRVELAGKRFTFVSGTAAIKGHATVAPDALSDQLECTLDNLRLISREVGAGDDLGAATAQTRHFKIYLRHAADFPVAKQFLERSLLRPADKVSFLRSDICRAALRVEIEATLVS